MMLLGVVGNVVVKVVAVVHVVILVNVKVAVVRHDGVRHVDLARRAAGVEVAGLLVVGLDEQARVLGLLTTDAAENLLSAHGAKRGHVGQRIQIHVVVVVVVVHVVVGVCVGGGHDVGVHRAATNRRVLAQVTRHASRLCGRVAQLVAVDA